MGRMQRLLDQHPAVRWVIGLMFLMALFCGFHFRHVRVPALRMGQVADRYLVAPIDFSYPDETATDRLRHQAAASVGPIYRIDPTQLHKERAEIEQEIGEAVAWQPPVRTTIGEAVDRLSVLLSQVRWSDAGTSQWLDQQHAARLIAQKPPVGGQLPRSFWQEAGGRAWEEVADLPSDAASRLVQLHSERGWQWERDLEMEQQARDSAAHSVPVKMRQVTAGSRLLDPGDRVSAQHLAMLQSIRQAMERDGRFSHPKNVLASLVLTLVVVTVGAVFLRQAHRSLYESNKRVALLVTIAILTLGQAKLVETLLFQGMPWLCDLVRCPVLIPFGAILITSLCGQGVGILMSALMCAVGALCLGFDPTAFFVTNLVASLVAVLYTHSLRKRIEIFAICGRSWAAASLVLLAFAGDPSLSSGSTSLWEVSASALAMIWTAVLIAGLLPLLESGFQVLTDRMLIEQMDPANELLRRLSVEAPGTYHHSVVTANLAESACEAIGANGLFCRAACLYHDVGKLINPHYFAENQQPGADIHRLLTPLESAHVIIGHVNEGVALARRAGLPEPFIDVIKEHHGTTLVYYFYRKEAERRSEPVDPRAFRYAGPKPRSKESAIIMLADSIEAASRTLESLEEGCVHNMVQKLMDDKVRDSQLEDCCLTFEELTRIKRSFIRTLVAAGHSRVRYPHPTSVATEAEREWSLSLAK
jgi:cyclic-di-AMP phosphodiesterase PgpH